MNRRSFLKTAARAAAGGLAFPCLVGSSVLGSAGTVAPSNRIVMGCIGVGGQGTYNLKAFLGAVEQVWYVANAPKLSKSSVQVVAVCDVDTKHRNRAGDIVNKRYNNRDCATYNDFRELLARDDIDAVTVCTPDHWHGVISIAAAKAGKDIYCEKPLTNTIAEGRAVCEAVKRYGRILQTGSHERSNDSVRFAAELVRNGYIGKLQTIRVNMPVEHGILPPQPVMPVPKGFDYDMWLGHTPWVAYTRKRCHGTFRYILDYSGGEMTDRGAHILDLAQLSNDADSSGPVELSGRGRRPSPQSHKHDSEKNLRTLTPSLPHYPC
ncbi:Inositol 2-dehydrogenase/D-chiro-inositol 3-dehydrogenase [subsurface metagenome]